MSIPIFRGTLFAMHIDDDALFVAAVEPLKRFDVAGSGAAMGFRVSGSLRQHSTFQWSTIFSGPVRTNVFRVASNRNPPVIPIEETSDTIFPSRFSSDPLHYGMAGKTCPNRLRYQLANLVFSYSKLPDPCMSYGEFPGTSLLSSHTNMRLRLLDRPGKVVRRVLSFSITRRIAM